ncbi:unnamed protein product [Urochloa humidicola]
MRAVLLDLSSITFFSVIQPPGSLPELSSIALFYHLAGMIPAAPRRRLTECAQPSLRTPGRGKPGAADGGGEGRHSRHCRPHASAHAEAHRSSALCSSAACSTVLLKQLLSAYFSKTPTQAASTGGPLLSRPHAPNYSPQAAAPSRSAHGSRGRLMRREAGERLQKKTRQIFPPAADSRFDRDRPYPQPWSPTLGVVLWLFLGVRTVKKKKNNSFGAGAPRLSG